MSRQARAGTVVLVHGLWMPGYEMGLLAARLRRAGWRTRLFRYPSLRRTPAENARRLAEFCARLGDPPLHLLAHSLGGILVLHLLAGVGELPLGRVLLLGSPVRGSGVARHLDGRRWGRWLLGRSGTRGLLGGAPSELGGHRVGLVVGSLSVGLGRLLGGYRPPGDGTVACAETELAGAADRLALPVSHTGLLLSAAVAAACDRFLEQGRFAAA